VADKLNFRFGEHICDPFARTLTSSTHRFLQRTIIIKFCSTLWVFLIWWKMLERQLLPKH